MRRLPRFRRLRRRLNRAGSARIADTAIEAFFGAAAGTLTTGDPVVGGTVGAGTPLAIRVAQAGRARIGHVRRVVTTETGMTVETIHDWATSSEERQDFLLKLLETARVAALEEKRVALGRIAARAVTDDTALDEATLFLDAVRDLDAPHIQVLKTMAAPRPGSGQLDGHLIQGVIGIDELTERVQSTERVVENVIARLRAAGTVSDATPSTWDQLEGRERWIVTGFGEELLRFLELRSGHEVSEQPGERD